MKYFHLAYLRMTRFWWIFDSRFNYFRLYWDIDLKTIWINDKNMCIMNETFLLMQFTYLQKRINPVFFIWLDEIKYSVIGVHHYDSKHKSSIVKSVLTFQWIGSNQITEQFAKHKSIKWHKAHRYTRATLRIIVCWKYEIGRVLKKHN